MKVFWAIVVALALAAGGLLLKRARSAGEHPALDVRETGSTAPAIASEMVAEPEDETAPRADDAAGDRDSPVINGKPAADRARLAETVQAPEPGGAPVAEPIAESGSPMAEVEATEIAAVDEPVSDTPETDEPAEAAAEEEGVFVLDGRHRIPGDGSAERPYVVDWDTLVALENEYDPKVAGKEFVPEWITPLDGKYVRLTGFIAFPFIAPSADECMVMLNQWDGCCIGVPPTPYDAVEVKLAEPIDLQAGIVNYGTLTGVFRTDPYLVNGWLIGLYVMEDAKIEAAGAKNQVGY